MVVLNGFSCQLTWLMLQCWCARIGMYRVSACAIPLLSKTSCACGERGPGVLVLSGLASHVFVPSYVSLCAPLTNLLSLCALI